VTEFWLLWFIMFIVVGSGLMFKNLLGGIGLDVATTGNMVPPPPLSHPPSFSPSLPFPPSSAASHSFLTTPSSSFSSLLRCPPSYTLSLFSSSFLRLSSFLLIFVSLFTGIDIFRCKCLVSSSLYVAHRCNSACFSSGRLAYCQYVETNTVFWTPTLFFYSLSIFCEFPCSYFCLTFSYLM
jgi:hypothetical protein